MSCHKETSPCIYGGANQYMSKYTLKRYEKILFEEHLFIGSLLVSVKYDNAYRVILRFPIKL